MSYYETPQQRQIRQQRQRIQALERQTNDANRKNRSLENKVRETNQRHQRTVDELVRQRVQSDAQHSRQIQQLQNQMQQREELQRQQIQRMQEAHQQSIDGITRGMEAQTQRFNREREQIAQEIQQLRADTRTQLEEQRRQIRQIRTEMSEQISDTQTQVTNLIARMQQDSKTQNELATYWVQESQRLLTQLRQDVRSQLIPEEKVRQILRDLEQAQANIRAGVYQTAIAQGQNAFNTTFDLRQEVAEAEQEWNYLFNLVSAHLDRLQSELNSARNRIYEFEMDGATFVDDHGIDYWTYDQLTLVQQRIEAWQATFEGVEGWTTAQLQTGLEEVSRLRKELELVEDAGINNLTMALERQRMPERIGEVLGERYRMVDQDGGFFAGEERNAYHALFQNPDTRDQILVVIEPVPDKEGVVSNHIDLLTGNADNNPVTGQRMTDTVIAGLNSQGIQGVSFPCRNRFGTDTPQRIAQMGNIQAVLDGKDSARAVASQRQGQQTTPVVTPTVKPTDS